MMPEQAPTPETKTAVTADDSVSPDVPAPTLEDEKLPEPPKLKKRSPKGLIVVLVVALVLAVAGAAGWYFFLREEPTQPAQQSQNSSQPAQNTTDDVPEATNSESFTSSPYRITFQYPKTWTVTENNDNTVLVQSQEFTYKTADGQSKKGNFRVYISKPAAAADSALIAKGVANQASTKLAYDKPTAAQRQETNLSTFGLDNENNFAFLLITGNFTLQKGDTLGPNFGKEIETILIGGGYSEPGLEHGMATNTVPVDGFQDSNAYQQAIAIIKSFEIM